MSVSRSPSPFWQYVWGNPERESLLTESPALMAMCFQEVMGALQHQAAHHLQHQWLLRRNGAALDQLPCAAPPIPDPLRDSRIVRDQVHVLLSCVDPAELFQYIFQEDDDMSPHEEEEEGSGRSGTRHFWRCLRTVVEQLCGSTALNDLPHDLCGGSGGSGSSSSTNGSGVDPKMEEVEVADENSYRWLHHGVGYANLFAFALPGLPGIPVSFISYINCVKMSESVLRYAMGAALSASVNDIPANRKGLITALALANIIPATLSPTAATNEDGITAEGLNFCMMPMPQQWWVLISAAVDRVFSVMAQQASSSSSAGDQVTKKAIWHRLALLSMLDTSHYMYAFPDRTQDAVAYQLLARLSEIGLVYPVKGPAGERCFVVSPHLRHGLQWDSATPVCSTSMLHSAEVDAPDSLRHLREQEMDTIITETNYRLFVYSINPDLLRVVEAFAVREEVVNNVLVCFRITRDSFSAALQKGLTALQVLQFLSSKAHPCMTERYGAASGGATTITDDAAAGDVSLCLPQSFVDQLLMWESEFYRVVFVPNMVLLQNVTPEQKESLRNVLRDYGELDAMVHEEPGVAVIREEVYNRLLARYISS